MTVEYPADFYARLSKGTLIAANAILPALWKKHAFKKVIDVGCGTGAWLHVAEKLGAIKAIGIEGSQIPPELLLVSADQVLKSNLEEPLPVTDRFDLCICLEVAEHLSRERAETFVHEIAELSDVVLFSAAIPFQSGHNHLNEQWPEYWASLFASHGFEVCTALRTYVWRNWTIPWWYRQNLLLFVHKSAWQSIFPGAVSDDPRNLSVIHPEFFLSRMHNEARTKVFESLHYGWYPPTSI